MTTFNIGISNFVYFAKIKMQFKNLIKLCFTNSNKIQNIITAIKSFSFPLKKIGCKFL